MYKRLAAVALFALVAIAAIGPIRSYDYFWQLTTGRWIVDHHALPLSDPLALASVKTEWIDGEWLWQVAAYLAHSVTGDGGFSIVHALFVGAIFAAAFHLAEIIRKGTFINAEWQMSPAAHFPLLYVTIVAGASAFLLTREKRANLWRMAMFVLLAALAVRYVRNQGLYFAALPLLIPPVRQLSRTLSAGFAIAALVPIGWAMQRYDHTTGADPTYFPLRAVAKLKDTGLPGNIYNVDQFGGLLEWTFYPQRRALTDGRNELFESFIAADDRAHHDS